MGIKKQKKAKGSIEQDIKILKIKIQHTKQENKINELKLKELKKIQEEARKEQLRKEKEQKLREEKRKKEILKRQKFLEFQNKFLSGLSQGDDETGERNYYNFLDIRTKMPHLILNLIQIKKAEKVELIPRLEMMSIIFQEDIIILKKNMILMMDKI